MGVIFGGSAMARSDRTNRSDRTRQEVKNLGESQRRAVYQHLTQGAPIAETRGIPSDWLIGGMVSSDVRPFLVRAFRLSDAYLSPVSVRAA